MVSPPGADVPELRFFVPGHEMTMCVHATAACVALLAAAGRLNGGPNSGTATVSTGVGRLAVEWNRADPHAVTSVSVDQLVPVATGPNPDRHQVAAVLGLTPSDLGTGPVESWSASRPKLIVPLPDEASLHALTPHWEALWDLCDTNETTGIYAFAPARPDRPNRPAPSDTDNPRITVHARQFPARAGYPEDAATGVAAAALAGYLTHHDPRLIGTTGPATVRIRQGAAMGRPSLLTARLDTHAGAVTRVRIAGDVLVLGEETVDSYMTPDAGSALTSGTRPTGPTPG